jgi:hypothetical protein
MGTPYVGLMKSHPQGHSVNSHWVPFHQKWVAFHQKWLNCGFIFLMNGHP